MTEPIGTNGTIGTGTRSLARPADALTRRRLKKFSIYLFRRGLSGGVGPAAISAVSAKRVRYSAVRASREGRFNTR